MVLIDNRQSYIEVTENLESLVKDVIEKALNLEDVNIDAEVSVIFVDNASIREINREYRGMDKATDVLSFPMLEYPKGKVYKEVCSNGSFNDSDLFEGKLILGDMALSLEMVDVQRKEFGHSFEREAAYLIVHSVLHLLGYDHMEEEEKMRMRSREEEILLSLNLGRD